MSKKSNKSETIRALNSAIRVAGKKLPFSSAKEQSISLNYAGANLAEAYRIGAEEAQREIISRIGALVALNLEMLEG